MGHATRVEFWIDVGGTFTDCIARRPDGSLLRHKVLSSGITKGTVGPGSTRSEVEDPGRSRDPDGFWEGYRLRLLDAEGQMRQQTSVSGFDPATSTLRLTPGFELDPQIGGTYELVSDEEAPILAIRYLLGLGLRQPLPPIGLRLGTTRGTNALLTRSGARTAFVTTRGFADVLRIGYQNRPRLFELAIQRQAPLFSEVLEIDERISATGQVLQTPDEERIRKDLLRLRHAGIESLAVCLLHAFRFPQHERLVDRLAREVGFEEVSRSSEVAPLAKIVSRGHTTVVDAYLNPVLRSYVAQIRASLSGDAGQELRLLTSAGGLVSGSKFVGKDSILSGPAGGVVGTARVAQAAGLDRVLGLDMGGTSTDVSRYEGRFEYEYETEKAGVPMVSSMLAIQTVAAGGGSVCQFDGVKLVVGPESAGADPGPACYGRGGPLAVTDLNFFLGKLLPDHFPFRLSADAVRTRLDEIRLEVRQSTGRWWDPVELADGFVRVANSNMAKAIRTISIAKGCDPQEYALVAFGGAAAQHACAIAAELGIGTILNHPDAGILSAYGVGLADVTRHAASGVYQVLTEALQPTLDRLFEQLTQTAVGEVLSEGVGPDRLHVRRSLDLRYQGTDTPLTIDCTAVDEAVGQTVSLAEIRGQHASAHLRLYGYVHDNRELEVVAVRVEASGRSDIPVVPSIRVRQQRIPESAAQTTAYFHARPFATSVYHRGALRPGDLLTGPAIVLESLSTTVIDPYWSAEMLSGGELLLTTTREDPARPAIEEVRASGDAVMDRRGASAAPDSRSVRGSATSPTDASPSPTMLEIFNNHFAEIAEQMGITLRNTSTSVNVKERLDFSCAVFTAEGDLVVNAPHIPVHLGAMADSVRHVLSDSPDLQPEDVFVTNDPYRGGSHLPDVTVVTPVHDQRSGELRFVTASRAHHAEIGGIAPGSMPPFSRNLAEEGVLIRNFKVVAAGIPQLESLRGLLESARYPSRSVADNMADLTAQIAANHQGVRDLHRLIDHYGWPAVSAYMDHIQVAAETKMRSALRALPDGCRAFTDHLDDGSPISVSITIQGDQASVDFTGTGEVVAGNLNANRAIVTAAVLYCMRCLIDEDIPLNQGVLAPIEIILPRCLLNPPRHDEPESCAAVAGGNVETSQRVVDVLLGALGTAAASQGTMNNLLFGDGTFGYYETICGGSGATADADGVDAIHTHMTNTRLTDPEVLEQRFPVRLIEFSVRRGSGGAGRHRGGNGVTRQVEFLQELELTMLSQRRGPFAPFGLEGGQPGALGKNTLRRAEGPEEPLPGCFQTRVEPGDRLIIETPGGGGYGEPKLPARN